MGNHPAATLFYGFALTRGIEDGDALEQIADLDLGSRVRLVWLYGGEAIVGLSYVALEKAWAGGHDAAPLPVSLERDEEIMVANNAISAALTALHIDPHDGKRGWFLVADYG